MTDSIEMVPIVRACVRGCLDDLEWDPIQSTFSFSPIHKT